jgi:arsenical pump membrane protein
LRRSTEIGCRKLPDQSVRLRFVLLALGILTAAVAAVLAHRQAVVSAEETWPPFVLVTGLLLIGLVANHDGVFAAIAGFFSSIVKAPMPLYLCAMALVAVVTALLNLDTSVAFLTPVLVTMARLRQAGETRFLYGCVFMSNAASLLLPGSNLTNLLVIAHQHIRGSAFFSRMLLPWLAAILVTTIVVALAFPIRRVATNPAPTPRGRLAPLSVTATLIAVLLVLLLDESALPVLAAGLVLVLARLGQRRIRLQEVRDGIDIMSLLGVYLVAVALGTLARTWSFPSDLMHHAGLIPTAAIASLASVLLNNLPAAVLLGSGSPAHPQALLFGLNIGPNLAVTGSLSALIWWQAAHAVKASPSAIRYSAVGIILVPLTLAAVLGATRL